MSAGSRHGRLRAGLVIGEVALSVLLLAGAGLLIRSLLALQHVELSWNQANDNPVILAMPNQRFNPRHRRTLFFARCYERVKALPGVTAATVTFGLPAFGFPSSEVTIPGKTHAEAWQAELDLCDDEYFKTLGLPLLWRRLLSEDDVASARHVIVINEKLARAYFKDEDPVGRTVKFNVLDQVPDMPRDIYFEIVGIVSDMKNVGLRDAPMPQAFMPYSVTGVDTGRAIMVKTAVAPLSLLPDISPEIWDVDSNVALSESGSIESYLQQYGYALPEFSLIALGTFAAIGLVIVIIRRL